MLYILEYIHFICIIIIQVYWITHSSDIPTYFGSAGECRRISWTLPRNSSFIAAEN